MNCGVYNILRAPSLGLHRHFTNPDYDQSRSGVHNNPLLCVAIMINPGPGVHNTPPARKFEGYRKENKVSVKDLLLA